MKVVAMRETRESGFTATYDLKILRLRRRMIIGTQSMHNK